MAPAEAAPAQPEAVVAPAIDPCTLCPMAPFVGKPWSEMPEAHLRHALAKTDHPDMTAGHRAAIEDVLAARMATTKGGA